jgi:hypothetical protein
VNSKDKSLNLYKKGSKNYRKIYCLYYGLSLKDLKGYHIHHIDGNHQNNHPENLMKCTPEEHAELHKQEGLSNWISLQNYAAVKGGKIAGKIKNTSLQMKSVWSSYTKEERNLRIEKVAKVVKTDNYRQKMSQTLRGKKKPLRSEEHVSNWKKSKSIGFWFYENSYFLSANDLAKNLNLPIKSVYKWCKFGDSKKITKSIVSKHSHIFNINDLGKTYKEKGFFFKNK